MNDIHYIFVRDINFIIPAKLGIEVEEATEIIINTWEVWRDEIINNNNNAGQKGHLLLNWSDETYSITAWI